MAGITFFLLTQVKTLYGELEILLLFLLVMLVWGWILNKMTDAKKPTSRFKKSTADSKKSSVMKSKSDTSVNTANVNLTDKNNVDITESVDNFNNEGIGVEVQKEVLMETQQQQISEQQQISKTESDTNIKSRIHLVDGEKGGVGKSLFCRVLLEYCDSKGYSDRLDFVESDLSNPDVGTIYFGSTGEVKNYKTAEFTKEEKNRASADIVFELATKKSVVVNLPSNIYASVTAWFDRNQIFTLAEEYGIQVCKWFVCNGGHSSLEKFKESVKDNKLKPITHIFVRNKVIFDDWEFLKEDAELKEILDRPRVFQMDFPQFGFEERNKVDRDQLTFKDALSSDRFGLLGKQRINTFLRSAYEGFDRLNLLP